MQGMDIILTEKDLPENVREKFNRVIQIINIPVNENQKFDPLKNIRDNPEDLFCLIPKSYDPDNIKLAELSNKSYMNTLSSLRDELFLDSDDVVLCHSPYSTGYEIIEILLPMMVGATVYLYQDEKINNAEILQSIISEQQITTILFTPAVWDNVLAPDWKIDNKIKALSSGEYLRPNLSEKLLNTFSEIWNLYGTIETSIFSIINKLNPESLNSLGKTSGGNSVVLVDQNLVPVPVGKSGEILISVPGLADSYHKNLTSDDQVFINISIEGKNPQKYFRTGDLARYNSRGEIEFLSAHKRRVKIRSFHFETRDVENLLLESPLIKDAFLVRRTNIRGECHYIGYVRLQNDESDKETKETIRNLRRFLLKRIPAYIVPENLVIIQDIPVGQKNRIDFDALPFPEVTENYTDDYVAPGNETEKKLAEIFKNLLKVTKVSIKDSFFDLGGQSLLAVRLFNRIEEEFGQRFPLALLFNAPTVEELAKRLLNENEDNYEWQSLIPIQPKGSRKPLYLIHGAGGNVLLYKTLSKYLEPDYPLYGLQSQGLDGRSKPLNTVEEMAEHYLREIRKVQPSGPYFIGGYCLGGTIAYEMAQRLLRTGEKVGIVVMLDTYNFALAEKASFTSFIFEKFKFHVKNFTHLKPSEMLSYLKEKKRLAGDGGWANIRTEMPGTTLDDSFGRAESGIELSVQTINDHAGDIYRPKPYKGELTLFKPQKNYSFYSDPNMGWGDLVKDLDIIELPINPHAMLVEPYVATLAEELRKRLNSR